MARDQELEVTTEKFRVSFPELFEAKSFNEGDAKYSIQMLFDKKTDLTKLKNAVKLAAQKKWGDKPLKGLVLPFKDGNEKDLEGYENTTVVGASTKFAPAVVAANKTPITNPEELYAGCYARAYLQAYAWEYKQGNVVMKRGVSFTLNAVQKLGEGERLVKRRDMTEVFDEVDDGSSDKANYESSDDDFMM